VAAPAGIYITEIDGAAGGFGDALAVKDLFDTAGVRTTYGSAVFADHVPNRTATAVDRLVRSSYRMVGKANPHANSWRLAFPTMR